MAKVKTNKTPCRGLPRGTPKEELLATHKQKMDLKKAAIAHEYNTSGKKRRYRIEANVSQKHKNHGLHPKEAY